MAGLLLVEVGMFAAAVGLVVHDDDTGFGYMYAAVAALAHILGFARLQFFCLGIGGKQPFQQPKQQNNNQ